MSSSYDRAITVFSPDGHLFQVEYAMEAVRKGTAAVAVRTQEIIVLCVEKKSTAALQEARTVRKILPIDEHLSLAFAGLTADARVLVNKARIEAQSYRLTVEDRQSVEHCARFMARTQQKYTQKGGRRPFGISTLLVGHDQDGTPHLFTTDPSGTYSEWTANAIGRNNKSVSEYLEKHHTTTDITEAAAIGIAVSALLEVVESGGKNIEIGVMRAGKGCQLMDQDEVDAITKKIQEEKDVEKSKNEKKSDQ